MSSTVFFLLLTIVASAAFVVIEVYLIRKSKNEQSLKMMLGHWRRVTQLAEKDPKHAVVEADKLLEYLLTAKRKKHTSVGDVLKKSGKKLFSDLDDVWRVHKLRNRIVHEMGFEITSKDATEALQIFRTALCDLGVKLPRQSTHR